MMLDDSWLWLMAIAWPGHGQVAQDRVLRVPPQDPGPWDPRVQRLLAMVWPGHGHEP